MSLTRTEPFYHCPQVPCLVVGVERATLQTGPAVYNTNVQLGPKFHRFSGFSPDNRANKRLTDTDDTIRNAVRSVVIHVLLLLVDGSQRIQPLHLPVGQGLPKKELAVNRFQIPLEIAQLLSNGFAGHFCGVFAASCVLQVVFPGALAVGAGLLSFCRVMEHVQELLGVLSGLVEQGNVLGIPDIGGRTGGVHDHSAAVSTSSRSIIRVIVILVFDFF